MSPPATSINYDHYLSPIGSLILAATDQGLCAIVFVGGKRTAQVDDRALQKSLQRALREYLPAALHSAPTGRSQPAKRTPQPKQLADPNRSLPWKLAPDKLRAARRWLDSYFAGSIIQAEDLEMPLDLYGTPFQLKVWKQLTRIVYGQTVSYGQIAKKIRQPRAARAVGLANNRNPIPIVIPCHRVVGADGKLVGYGGGLWRKKALLRLEEGDLFGAF